MGNQLFKCPVEAVYGAAPLSCVMSCPNTYELKMVEGAQRCVNIVDPTVSIHLIAQPAVGRKMDEPPMFNIESLKQSDADAYTRYSVELARFKRELEKADLKVKHTAKVDAAARNVLAASGNDSAANAEYASLTNDPDALKRLYDTQIEKDTQRFMNEYQFLQTQSMQQQQSLDLINSVKDNLLTVKDDIEYSVEIFGKQVNDIRNQININRKIRQQAVDYGTWLNIGLNLLIVFALIYLLFVVGRKWVGRSTPTPAPTPPSANTNDFFNAFTKYLTASAPAGEKK